MNLEIIKTADRSPTLYIKELNEHYHSTHGAIQESKHVFINAGLKKTTSSLAFSPSDSIENKLKEEYLTSGINILEIGLGTGLNALLTFIETEQLAVNINYTAIEAYPISIDLAGKLNYAKLLNTDNYQSVFSTIHSCDWEKFIALSNQFTIYKIENTLQKIKFENIYHLIYFDAFSPQVQPDMWTEEIFTKIYSATQSQGCLVTYCAKGEVKRTLKKVGFTVESLPGPIGKREMVRAMKN